MKETCLNNVLRIINKNSEHTNTSCLCNVILLSNCANSKICYQCLEQNIKWSINICYGNKWALHTLLYLCYLLNTSTRGLYICYTNIAAKNAFNSKHGNRGILSYKHPKVKLKCILKLESSAKKTVLLNVIAHSLK